MKNQNKHHIRFGCSVLCSRIMFICIIIFFTRLHRNTAVSFIFSFTFGNVWDDCMNAFIFNVVKFDGEYCRRKLIAYSILINQKIGLFFSTLFRKYCNFHFAMFLFVQQTTIHKPTDFSSYFSLLIVVALKYNTISFSHRHKQQHIMIMICSFVHCLAWNYCIFGDRTLIWCYPNSFSFQFYDTNSIRKKNVRIWFDFHFSKYGTIAIKTEFKIQLFSRSLSLSHSQYIYWFR